MGQFTYKARKDRTQIIEGVIDADYLQQAVKKISDLGYMPFEVRPCTEISKGLQQGWSSLLVLRQGFSHRISRSHSVQLTRHLADLLEAHIPVLRALNLVKGQIHLPLLKNKIEKMIQIVQDGGALSEAMSAFPEIFPSYYVQMVKAGELGGNLNDVLSRLASHLEKSESARRKFLNALLYPMFIVIVGFLSLIVLLTWVVPQLSTILSDLDQKLPWMTIAFLSISHFCVRWGGVVLVMISFLVAAGLRFYNTPSGQIKIDQWILHSPILGIWFKTKEMSTFLRTLAMLATSGIHLTVALEAAFQVVHNEHLRQKFDAILHHVRSGTSLSHAMREANIFSESDTTMISVAEETGTLPEALSKLACHYERWLDEKMRLILSLLEPALILGVGLIVGAVVLAFLVPMMNINMKIR